MERHNQKIHVVFPLKKYFTSHWIALLFIAFFFTTVAFKLLTSVRPFYDWDESLYVQVGREMVQHRFFLAPIWQGKIWFDKPPLSPLFFGITTLMLPFQPEVSARILVLLITTVILALTYGLYYRVTKNSFIATLTLIATAYSPIFLQRSQVVSLDIFLLLGWVGYFVFLNNSIISVLFLFLSVQSKSLLGFYPLGVYLLFLIYQLVTKKITRLGFYHKIKILFFQSVFLSSWYVIMLILYQGEFWQTHIIESHFRRVTASIESHFGQRTFYIDLLREQLGWFLIPSVVGFVVFTVQWIRHKVSDEMFLLGTAFIPWFIFLNLTKTKISWYLYPVVPQFFFLAAYPLMLLRKKKVVLAAFAIIIAIYLVFTAFVKNSFFTTFYSGFDSHVLLSQQAQKNCKNLAVLVSPSTRSTFYTLKKLGLIITTTDWWGDHPSMVYYFQRPLTFFYYPDEFAKSLPQFQCASIYNDDVQLLREQPFSKIDSYTNMILYKHD